ncbi:MAG: FG-GAP-like repeat-containing protein [Caldilineaceae bacterium]
MDMLSIGRLALRFRAPTGRVNRVVTLIFSVLLLFYHSGLPTSSASFSLPTVRNSVTRQAVSTLTPRLFYPAVYYSYSDNGRTWNSTLTVQNHANTSATVEIVFYNTAGQASTPSSLPTTGNNTIQNPVTLPAGGAATIRLDTQTFIPSLSSNSRYAVVVNSDQLLVGVNWVRVAGSGNESHGAYQGVTVGSRGPIYLPAVAYAVDNFTSNLAIQNLSNSTLTGVTLNFYNQNGNQAGQPNTAVPPIPAYATAFVNLAGFSMPGIFSGAVVVNSPNGPVAVVDNKIGGANGYTLFSDNGITSAGNTRYAPFLTTESGASATVTIQNTSNNQAATVTVTNSDNVGNTQLNLPPRGSQTVSYSTGSHGRPFAATISANQPVVATAAVLNTAGRAYAYQAAAQGATAYRLPLMVTNYQNSGSNAVFSTNATLFNPGPNNASVQLLLSNGSRPQTSLLPGEVLHMGNLNIGGVGSAVLVSSQPIFGGVLLTGQPAIGQQATGDLQAFYPGVLPPPPPATLTKTANTPHLKPGDPLTYTLTFAAGADGGAALLVDWLPSQLQNYSYQAGAGVMVTPTGNVDYAWEVAVPAAGGVITVSGIVDPAIVTDTLILNTATITTTTSSVSRSVNVTVDVAPPDTTIVSKPTDPSKESTPTFQFSINDGAGSGLAGFECQIDNGNWSSCNTSFTTSTLSDGPHTIAVRAIDQVGYVDASPATYNWTIDTAAPATPTLLTPANGSTINNSQFVTFTWSAVAAADLAGYKLAYNEHLVTVGPATSYTVGPLANGAYTWTVAAYDTLSNTSTFAGAASFTMNVAAPQPLAMAPLVNSHVATVTTPVSITFDQPIAAATVNTRTFAIHAMQSGQRLQSYSTNGATITFTPDQPFKPGELVQVSAASGLKGVNGFALLPPKVWQFRAATTGGAGQFVTGSSFGSQHAYDGRLGDMDGDGDLDFLVINYGSGRNNLYLNDGDGTFDTTMYDMGPSSNYQQAVALGDVNGDGRVDVALSNDNNTDTIYLNDGTGHPFDTTTLTLSANSARTNDLAFGDIDGDGDQDLIRCETGALSFYLNNGNNNGTRSFAAVSYPKPFFNCYRVAVGDVNGDGRLDLVFGVAAGIFIYLNDGSGNPFSGPIYQVNGTAYQLTYDLLLGDLDGDGDLDLAINNQSPDRSNKIYFNDGDGNPYNSTTTMVGPASGTRTDAMALGDVDGDGDLDVITGNWATNGGGAQDLIYLNDGSGAFPATSNLGPGGFSNMTGGLDVGDLDGDGDLDVVAAMTNNFPQLSYLNNNAPLPVTPTATPSATPTPTIDPSLPTPTPTNTVDPSLPTPTPTNTVDPSLPTPTPTNTVDPSVPTPTRTPTTNAPTLTPTATPIPGSPTPTPTLPVADATTVAQPNQPAALTYSDPSGGGVVVQIPVGAIDQPTTFLYDDQGAPSQPGAFQFAGRTFTLTAYRNNSPLDNFTFQQPVTLVIDYTDSDVAGIDENSLTLFFYDETTGVWSDQGIIVVARDPANNRLTVQIPHLTEFAMGVTNRVYMPVVTR